MVVMMGGGTGGEDDIICSLINFDYQWLNNTGVRYLSLHSVQHVQLL